MASNPEIDTNPPIPPVEVEVPEEKEELTCRPGYTYDPSQIMDGSFNQMRFELGDTVVNPKTRTLMMSDSEYKAVIENSKDWRSAKISCLRHILMQFAYEVDFTIDGLSYSLSDRYDRFKKMLDDLLKNSPDAVPTIDEGLLGAIQSGGGHFFYYGMLENPRRK